MSVEHITNLQALMFIAGVFVFAWIVFKLIPGPAGSVPQQLHFSEEQITEYDRELPKYFLAAAFALFLGGLHTVLKNLPGIWQWLWDAGYGGHLVRDLSNSHIIIVGGGTVLLTAFTWYALPRFVNRPLYSKSLASMSFWLTILGVFGFYTAWLVLGGIEGNMVRHGWEYQAAKDSLGNLHRIPTALTSSIMGFGYWTYVLNVFLTVFAARHVKSKPLNYLTKFCVVSASALFVGTVQGVIQVMPANADWIHAAGHFGEYVDPISHAHINLVTGMMVSLIAFLIYFGPRMGGKQIGQRQSNRAFWLIVTGSLAFYFTFLFLGLILGGAKIGQGGIQSPGLVPTVTRWRGVLLAFSGTWMLAGFWMYFHLLFSSLGSKVLKEIREATPAGFWLASGIALFIGTLQGLFQAIPATHELLTTAEEIPNIHAQLNMVGGVLLALIGVVYLLLPELVGKSVDRHLRRTSLAGIGLGIGGYYLMTLVTGLMRSHYLNQGLNDTQVADQLSWLVPVALSLTALPMLVGYFAFGRGLWQVTEDYRAQWLADLKSLPVRYNGTKAPWRSHIPVHYYLMIEGFGAMVGFPGIGWLSSGQALWGLPLALAGPGIAWAVVPLLMSPYADGPFASIGAYVLLAYLMTSTLLSVSTLWFVLTRQKMAANS